MDHNAIGKLLIHQGFLSSDSELKALIVISKEQIETMDAIWDGYGDYGGKYLERLTHQEDPWIEARGDCSPGEYCDNKISIESMKEYYTKVYDCIRFSVPIEILLYT